VYENSKDLIKKYFVNVEGVYVKDDKILLLKRNVIPFKGFWHLVGGQVEENETLKEALKREFKEETTLDVNVGDIIDGRIEETFDRTKIIITYKILGAQGKITLNHENEEYGWYSKIPSNTVYDFGKYLER
jgi:8-oxo-dGTP diphosphatase